MRGRRHHGGSAKAVIGRPTWITQFLADGGAGAYLRVLRAGRIRPGDEIALVDRPDHTVAMVDFFLARTVAPELASQVLKAAADLDEADRGKLQRRAQTILG